MKVWSGVKSILDRTPFRVKFYIGFILMVFFIMGFVTLHAYIKRPEQIQKLLVYEQKLESISVHKVSEEHFATGKNGQIYVFKKTLNCNMKLNSIQIYNFINFFKKDIQGGSII